MASEIQSDDGADRRGRSMTRLSRRGFLGAGAGALAALPALPAAAAEPAMSGMNHAHGPVATQASAGAAAVPPGDGRLLRVPFMAGEPLVEPEVRRAVDGVLATTLRAAYAYRDVGGYRLFVRTYEGTVPGPTLRLAPGDTLKIDLVNDLPPNRDPMPAYIDQPHRLNTTNFHFHGAHVDPGGISDNVMRSMEPGLTHKIEITLPEDHPRGSYWYHPHHHGSADVQLASGMVGAVVIEGDFADVPEIAAARERVLVLSEIVHDGFGMIEGFETLFPETAARFFTINGHRAPEIDMRPGEVQRWRLFHTGYQDDFFLKLDGHTLQAIARDGIPLPRMGTREIRSDADATDPDAILIAPGQRVDVLVKAGPPGLYDLKGLPYDQGYPSPTGLFARIRVAGELMDMALPAALPPAPFPDIADAEVTGRRTLTFSAITPEADAAGHWSEFSFLIDGKPFDMNRVDQRVKLGAVEEWTVVNAHRDDHIFHIHVNPFQLVAVNGAKLTEPVWLDTAVLPRGGSITFRSRFLDFTGTFMLHCHMMNHEELGMMQVVEVYEE